MQWKTLAGLSIVAQKFPVDIESVSALSKLGGFFRAKQLLARLTMSKLKGFLSISHEFVSQLSCGTLVDLVCFNVFGLFLNV